jgi:hypothetical protein
MCVRSMNHKRATTKNITRYTKKSKIQDLIARSIFLFKRILEMWTPKLGKRIPKGKSGERTEKVLCSNIRLCFRVIRSLFDKFVPFLWLELCHENLLIVLKTKSFLFWMIILSRQRRLKQRYRQNTNLFQKKLWTKCCELSDFGYFLFVFKWKSEWLVCYMCVDVCKVLWLSSVRTSQSTCPRNDPIHGHDALTLFSTICDWFLSSCTQRYPSRSCDTCH